jgi:hypothetical protein
MDMDMDGPPWVSHEYWKMKVSSLHKNELTGEKWVLGTWFYTPEQLRDQILKERYSYLLSVFYISLFDMIYRSVIPFMGNTELVLSTHRDVINPSCIECKVFFGWF